MVCLVDNTHNGYFVSSGVVRSSERTISAEWWELNEYMFDFSGQLTNSNMSNYQIRAVILAGTFTWSDGDDTHNVIYKLSMSKCNMWLAK